MNDDILKGKWQEIKGGVREKFGQLTDNNLDEIEGKGEKLLGLLRKKYGYFRDRAVLDDKDSMELVEIISRIREIKTKDKESMIISFITRYGHPLLVKKQKKQISGTDETYGYGNDRYSDSRLRRRAT